MKKLFPLSILLLSLIACNPAEEDKETKLIIHAENADTDFLLLMDYEGFEDTIHRTSDGLFIYKFDTIKKVHRYFIPRNRELAFIYIDNYETVELHTDFNNFEKSAIFSGDRADMNNYLVKKRMDLQLAPFDKAEIGSTYDEFKAWADANLDVSLQFLSAFEKDDPDNVFWSIQEANIIFKWAAYLEKYPTYYKIQPSSLPDYYLDFRKGLVINNPDYLGSSVFTDWLSDVIKQTSQEQNPELEDAEELMAYLHTAEEMIDNDEIRDYIWVDFIKESLRRTPILTLEPCIDYVRKENLNPEQLERLNLISDEWKALDTGQPAFNFVAENLDGKEVKFSDFAGKYVYIDVWATWCGPCIKEIPYLKQLEKDYHDRNIVFVSYSIDSDKQSWLDFVPKNELGGVQIIGDNAWKSTLTKYYKVTSVPTFLFFSPEGKIINVKMTRPSNPETRKAFDSYSDL